MSDKTPKRPTTTQNSGFSPVSLPESPAAASPQKNITGLPRVVRDLVADEYNAIQRWNDLHIKGASLVKEIASLKSDNPKEFSKDLEVLIDDLYSLVQSLRNIKDLLLSFANQIKASEQLQRPEEPLFLSLGISCLSNLVEDVSKAYESEFNMKDFVLENIAYSKNKDEAMFLAALWVYQTKITDCVTLKMETLLVETGHRKFS